jgi:hypothetical protein
MPSPAIVNLGVAQLTDYAQGGGTAALQSYATTMDLVLGVDIPTGYRIIVYETGIDTGASFSVPGASNTFHNPIAATLSNFPVWYCDVVTPLTAADKITMTVHGYKDWSSPGTHQTGTYLLSAGFGAIAVPGVVDFFGPGPGATNDTTDSDGAGTTYQPATGQAADSGGFGYAPTYTAKEFNTAWNSSRQEFSLVRLYQETDFDDVGLIAADHNVNLALGAFTAPTANGAAMASVGMVYGKLDGRIVDTTGATRFSNKQLVCQANLYFASLSAAGVQHITGDSITSESTYTSSSAAVQANWASWYAALPASIRNSTVLTPTRGRRRAIVDSAGALKLLRYNDAFPPAVAATLTVEPDSCTGCSLICRPDGTLALAFAKSDTVYERRSRDGGRSFGVADAIAAGYQDVATAENRTRGLKVVMLYKQSESKWYAVVGRQSAAGGSWVYPTAPIAAVTNAKAGACLIIRPDGSAEFDYTTTADAQSTVRCRKYSVANAGTWT